MGYRTLAECVEDLRRSRQLVEIKAPVDPNLELAAIQRRVYQAGGPALLFTQVRGCAFPVVSNVFGTLERAKFLFRDTLAGVRALVDAKVSVPELLRAPDRWPKLAAAATRLVPKRRASGPCVAHPATLAELPKIVSWPRDGGPFITLPLVYTEDPDRPGFRFSNLGMYRIQLGGNAYQANEEVGLHYQIHRGIGVHHAAAARRGEPLRVVVSVGGPPALWLAAVMPLPEGLPELAFAGALGGRSVVMVDLPGGLPAPAESDFVIEGVIDPTRTKPEGPFGDHLGYYSLIHDFPVMRVENVWHRPRPIWPYTSVGRPPQEDTTFGALIHELTSPLIPNVLPGVNAVHAVDAAGVHPLLLAIGSERYVPYQPRRVPMELLTQANAILGQGQMSLAKYLWIAAIEDNRDLDIHDIPAFFQHMLERVDWQRDLHFQTCTTIDTLDYSGDALNQGSKLVIACVGPAKRTLARTLPAELSLPEGFSAPRLVLPGVVAVEARSDASVHEICERLPLDERFPLITLVDDSEFTARHLRNWLWETFTRSNPAADVHGVDSFTHNKHWGCRGSLVIDARTKPHHAPPLLDDSAIERRVDVLAAPGGPLHGIL